MAESRMLLDLYRCVDDPGRWTTFLDHLCDQTAAQSAVMQVFRFDGGAVRIVWQQSDSRTARQRAPAPHRLGSVENPRLDRDRMLRSADRVVRDDDLFARDEPARASLRSELAAAGLGAFLGLLRSQPDGRFLGLALHRGIGNPREFEPPVATRLESLGPHVDQAWRLAHRLGEARAETQRLQASLDALRCALLFCDAEGSVRWMNRSAGRLLGAGAALSAAGRTLRAASAADSQRLREELSAAASGPCGVSRHLAVSAAGRTLHLALQRCQTEADDAPGVMIAVTDARALVDVPADRWCRLLGVTPAEGHLVATLVQGRTVEEHAAQRGISVGTARNQLKQALAKTGTSRQADLVRLALSSAAVQVLDVAQARRGAGA